MAKILIVDDHPLNREFLVALLQYQGHHLLQAPNGRDGLAVVRAERPDLVITDILMPVMDGYEFVREIRKDPVTGSTRVIFYTAHYLEREAKALADSGGVSRILTKPSPPELILETVSRTLAEDEDPGFAPPAEIAFDREHRRVLSDKLAQSVDELRSTSLRLRALLETSRQVTA